jgi:undecaprenyl diphosphate synthase
MAAERSLPAEFAPPGSVERRLLDQLDLDRLPRHVAIIMDGNGRWALARGLSRVAGHRAGVRAARETVEAAARLGIEVLTLYAFSQENWNRPRFEVDTLMALLHEYLEKELGTLQNNNIKLRGIGQIERLPRGVQARLGRAMELTATNTGLALNVALSYGGRAEIVEACRALIRDGIDPDHVNEAAFERRLSTAGQPDPDLVIRTSGEVRISNFLLWQIAYAELWAAETLWPDFRRRHFLEALVAFQNRRRRFGQLSEEPEPEPAALARP